MKPATFLPVQANNRLKQLQQKLIQAKSLEEKEFILDKELPVKQFFSSPHPLHKYLSSAPASHKVAVKALAAVNQAESVFYIPTNLPHEESKARSLLSSLAALDAFYDKIGGLAGYHYTVMRLLNEEKIMHPSSDEKFLQPYGIDLGQDTEEVREAILTGIKFLPKLCEIYPVGGAGDRLGLADESTGEALPAIRLVFQGHTLLENMIRDLQGREYLHYKLFQQQVTTPIALMTSDEKNNHEYVKELCRQREWFNRGEEHFLFFKQPSVPVLTEDGSWSLQAPLELTLKPGGHGVIWKLAKDSGTLKQLSAFQRAFSLIRQVNNPIAGVDSGLLGFTGAGILQKKSFGFASCPRLVGTAEGVNVLKEEKTADGYRYSITNIEYTDFTKKNIPDIPKEESSPYSCFPSNTNILFADLKALPAAVERLPIPGMIINMKTKAPKLSPEGKLTLMKAGRLESTMQNIADALTDSFPQAQTPQATEKFQTFLSFNKRHKTISVTKKLPSHDKYEETPQSCLYDFLQNARELLVEHCHMQVPALPHLQTFVKQRPPFLFSYHPALGPLYSIIGQKLRRGSLQPYSEWKAEIAELDVEDIYIEGSLLIKATAVMGHISPSSPRLIYSEQCGKCHLHRVRVINKGIDQKAQNIYWKSKIQRKEALTIALHGNAEFHAEDIVIRGSHTFEVPSGHRMTLFEKAGLLQARVENIEHPSWWWEYSITSSQTIALNKARARL